MRSLPEQALHRLQLAIDNNREYLVVTRLNDGSATYISSGPAKELAADALIMMGRALQVKILRDKVK